MAKELKIISAFGFVPNKSFQFHYDDIVDSSNFKSTKDLIRDMTAQDLNTSSTRGIYDYPKGEGGHKPTDIELLLRSGKLDKADVQVLAERERESIATEAEAQALEREKLASKNRTARIDQLLEKQINSLS